jgi:hypothetical protein
MSAQLIDWQGATGHTYRHYILPIGTQFKALPGNYIFARETMPGYWLPIYVGETANLAERHSGHDRLLDVVREGATHIHAHVSSASETIRQMEELDLARRWRPVCNRQGRYVGATSLQNLLPPFRLPYPSLRRA